MQQSDVVVIGGGIAGVSIAYELAASLRVCLLEAGPDLAQQTTGRSAATFVESFGPAPIRQLTQASRAFFEGPPNGFAEPLLSPGPKLVIGGPGAADSVRRLYDELADASVTLLDPDEAQDICPILRSGHVELALYDPRAMNVDVHGLVQGYARGLRERGGDILKNARVAVADRDGQLWKLTTTAGLSVAAPLVVNASGAWVDEVAILFGAQPVGIRPLRRTVFMLSAADHAGDTRSLPLVADIADAFYMKPEGELQFLCSPVDETLMAPGSPSADEIAIAKALDSINEATTLKTRHVRSTWAGLRSFTADRLPVVGFDDEVEGFMWFGAQGGYGIQAAPALARAGAGLVLSDAFPDDLSRTGLRQEVLHRSRLRSGGDAHP